MIIAESEGHNPRQKGKKRERVRLKEKVDGKRRDEKKTMNE